MAKHKGDASQATTETAAAESVWERFWTRPFSETRLTLFRFFFFACVALESFRDLEHAPRYGAGGFNVPHFDLLAVLPTPSRYAMVVLYLAQFALALRVAFGLGGRITVWVLTAIYGYTYFISQLDSYQHHYMVFLFLVLMSLVDWESDEPRAWPVHLVIVQTCIVYFWAGVTKAIPLWVDGTLLKMQVGPSFVEQVPIIASMDTDTGFAVMATYAMCMEFAVPAMILWRGFLPDGDRTREWLGWLAVVIGLPLHFGIEWAGLRIGLFSYMMMAFYLLVVPERFIDWVARVGRAVFGGKGLLVGLDVSPTRDVLLGLAVAFTAWTVWQLPLEYTGAAAVVVSATALASEWPPRRGRAQRAVGHALVGLTVLYAASTGDTMRQYWYYLGGDARRRGEVSLAIYGYGNTTMVDPEYPSGYLRHAMMLGVANRDSEAIETLQRGVEHVDPPDFELFEALALACSREGRADCARDAAAKAYAIKADPRMKAMSGQ